MLDRRGFIKSAASITAGGMVGAWKSPLPALPASSSLDRIGVGLFTIPHLLEQDFVGTMKLLSAIGYKEVEFFGPYPFSVPEVHEGWKALAGALGFSQSGYFGHTPQQMREILDEHGLTAPSMHIDLKTLQTRLDEVAEAAHAMGHRYAGIAAIQPEQRTSLDDYKRMADVFNEVGQRMDKVGLKFLYHNHGYGLVEMEGEIPFKVLIERTDPNLVVLELDIYWTTAGRANPVAYLDAYPDRFRLMHLKDMTEKVHFAGDGGDPSQWMELFPYMTDAGSGILDLHAIIAHACKAGVEHFYLERDLASDPDTTLKSSYQYLSSLEFED